MALKCEASWGKGRAPLQTPVRYSVVLHCVLSQSAHLYLPVTEYWSLPLHEISAVAHCQVLPLGPHEPIRFWLALHVGGSPHALHL